MRNDPLWKIRPFNNEWSINLNGTPSAVESVVISKDDIPAVTLMADGSVTIQTNASQEFTERYEVDLAMLDTALENLTSFLENEGNSIHITFDNADYMFDWAGEICVTGLAVGSVEEEFRLFLASEFASGARLSLDDIHVPSYVKELVGTEVEDLFEQLGAREQRDLISLIGFHGDFHKLRVRFVKVSEIIRNIENDIIRYSERSEQPALEEQYLRDFREYLSEHISPIYFN